MLDMIRVWLFDANDYRSALRRVGIAAIIVGVVDTIYFIAAIIHRQSYSTSLSIVAIIAGILLIKGNLKTCLAVARWIGWTGGITISLIGGTAIVILWEALRNEYDLLKAFNPVFHLETAALVQSMLFAALMVWAYRTLTSPALLSAMRSSGVDCDSFWRRPLTSFREGVVIGLAGLCLMLYFVGTSAHH
jgi:hypothetical protein